MASSSTRRAALACAALVLAGTAALASASSPSTAVVHLTSKDHDSKVSDGNVWLVKYFAPWCGHCKRLAPTWEELAAALKGEPALKEGEGEGKPGVRVAHVDCTTDKGVCAAQEIKGYPTLKVVHKGEAVETYRGARDLEALKGFAVETHRKLTSEV